MPDAPSPSEGAPEPVTPDPVDTAGGDTSSADAPTKIPDASDPAISSTADGDDPAKAPDPDPVKDPEDAKGPKTILEAVDAALKVDKGDKVSSADEGSGDAPAESKKPDAKDGEGDAKAEGDKDKPPPFHEHPRWKAVVAERDDWKGRAEKAEGDVESQKPSLEAIERISGYLDANNLTADEFNNILRIGGFAKNDPLKALEALTPLYNRLLEVTGYTLPPDLKQAVEQGLTTEEYARQTARARGDANIATFQSQTQGQRYETERNSAKHTALVQTLGDTASAWEQEWKASDPDYPKKVSLVRREVELAIHLGEIERTPEAVRSMLDEKRKKVEDEIRAFLPKPKAVNTNPTPGGPGGTSTVKKPETLMDAIDLALTR